MKIARVIIDGHTIDTPKASRASWKHEDMALICIEAEASLIHPESVGTRH